MLTHHEKKTRGGEKTRLRVVPFSASRVDLLGVLEIHKKTRVQLYPNQDKTRVHLEVQGEPVIGYTEKRAPGAELRALVIFPKNLYDLR